MSEKFEELLKNYDNCTPSASGTRAALVEYVTELETKVEQRTSALQYANQNVADFCHQIKDWQEENARLREAQRWIPVSERLPEKPAKCEAYIPRLDELPFDFVDFGIGFEGHKFFLHGMDITEFVTHWRPIPQPPEVE